MNCSICLMLFIVIQKEEKNSTRDPWSSSFDHIVSLSYTDLLLDMLQKSTVNFFISIV